MATTKPTGPTLISLNDDEYDAIRATGGPGKTAKPSAFAEHVAAADVQVGEYADNAGWYIQKATVANPIKVVVRELKKAERQHNKTAAPDDLITVQCRPRENHPKHGDFVAWRVVRKAPESVTTDSETAVTE